MRCMSCGADIPPQWIHAIATNICAGCGGEIMNTSTQDLLKELTEAMTRMPNDPQGIAGWLLSNYRFQKIGEAIPVEKFHRKGGSNIDEQNLKVDPSYNEFIKRNEATELVAKSNELAKKFKGAKGEKFAEMAAVIQSISDPYGDDIVNEKETDDDDVKAYAELKSTGFDPFRSSSTGDLSQAINPQEVINLLSNNSEEKPLREEIALASTAEGRGYLNRDRMKKIKAQEAVSGGGGGVFRR